MPEPNFYVKQGDTASVISATLTDDDDSPVNIQSANIHYSMAPIEGGIPTITLGTAINDQVGDGSDGSRGDVHYPWVPPDTDTPGLYIAEWQVTYASGDIQTFPNGYYSLVRITPEVG